MSNRNRVTPTPERPIVAYRPRDRRGRIGPPIPLNPVQSRVLSGDCPHPFELEEHGHYDGLAGLGRFCMEMATEHAVDPVPGGAVDGIGELGEIIVDLIPDDAFPGANVADLYAESVLARNAWRPFVPRALRASIPEGLAATIRADIARTTRGTGAALRQTGAAMTRGIDWRAAGRVLGRGALGIGAILGAVDIARLIALLAKDELGTVRRRTEQARQRNRRAEQELQDLRNRPPQPRDAQGRFTRRRFAGVSLAGMTEAGVSALHGAGAMSPEAMEDLAELAGRAVEKGRAMSSGDVAKALRKLAHARMSRNLMGRDAALRRCRDSMTALAGIGALAELAQADTSAGQRIRAAWQPTLAELGAACACHPIIKRDPLLSGLRTLAQRGGFEPTPAAAGVHAAGLAGLSDRDEVSAEQLAQLGAISNAVRQLQERARNAFEKLKVTSIPRATLRDAETKLATVVTSAANANALNTQVKQWQAQLASYEKARAVYTKRLAEAKDVAQRTAAQKLIDHVDRLIEERKRQIAKHTVAAREEGVKAKEAKVAVAPILQRAVRNADAAVQTETARVSLANTMQENGLLRGQLMTMTRSEYAQHIADMNAAKTASARLQDQARQLARQRERDARQLLALKVKVVKLEEALREAERRIADASVKDRVDEEATKARNELLERLAQLKDSFKNELSRIRNITDEAVDRAGDVVNRSGIQMMFQFLRDMTQSMRDIRDVTDAGEFLRLFPQVLQQLKLAQDIASPEKPVVNVTVPQQSPPTINVAPPSFNLTPQFEVHPASATVTPGAITVNVEPGRSTPIPGTTTTKAAG